MKVSKKNAGVIRKAILLAHKDVANYGTEDDFGPRPALAAAMYLTVSTSSMILAGRAYEIAYTKRMDARLASISDAEADALIKRANYFRMSPSERQTYNLRLEVANLEHRVEVMEGKH